MHINANTVFFDTTVEPQASGTKMISQTDGLVDVNELHALLNDPSNFVVIRNHCEQFSETTKEQRFIFVGKLATEVASGGDTNTYVDTYVMSMYSHTLSGIANRKVVLSFTDFGEDAKIKCTYYNS